MPTRHIYLPAEVDRRLDELPADETVSQWCVVGLIGRLGAPSRCQHTRLGCQDCGRSLGEILPGLVAPPEA